VSFYGLVDGTDASLKSYLGNLSGVDQVGAEARAAMLATRSIKTTSKRWAIDTAITMVDLTTLEGADTPGKVIQRIHQFQVLALCVFTTTWLRLLANTSI